MLAVSAWPAVRQPLAWPFEADRYGSAALRILVPPTACHRDRSADR
jgi:hypothetical protein